MDEPAALIPSALSGPTLYNTPWDISPGRYITSRILPPAKCEVGDNPADIMANLTNSLLGRYISFNGDPMADPIRPEVSGIWDTRLLPYYAAAIGCALFVAYLFQVGWQQQVDAPFYKASTKKWIYEADALIKDSYRKFRDGVYRIKATEGIQVLVPPKFVGELKVLPETTLSATEAIRDALMSKYTGFTPGHNEELLKAWLRAKLTTNLSRVMPLLKEEMAHIMQAEFPPCDDWTAVRVQPFALRAVASAVGRATVGPSLCRDEAWMDTSINFAVHVFVAAVKMQFIPSWLRCVGQFLLPDIRQIQRDITRAEALLRPVVEERLCLMEEEEEKKKENKRSDGREAKTARPDDFIQWQLDGLPEDEKRDVRVQAELHLILGAASIHTTNNLLVECLYDLAARPEVQDVLREEIEEVIGEDGGEEDHALWTQARMAQLHKMDSFIKEVQRLSGNVTSFIRKVVKPIDLSDGTHLPAGTKLLSAMAGISLDERFYPAPDTFDALRFYRLRRQAADAASNSSTNSNTNIVTGTTTTTTTGGGRFHLTSVSDTDLNFGAGRHACPGRFFAAGEIKMMLAAFLVGYDMRFREGEARPASVVVMMSRTANPEGEVLFRRRARKSSTRITGGTRS